MSLKETKLANIRNEDGIDLYVLNNTMNLGQASRVVMEIVADGGHHLLDIPATWVPINAGLQIPKELLLKNTNFLKSVSQKKLIPVSTADAEAFFQKDSAARQEIDRITAKLNGTAVNLDEESPSAPDTEVIDGEISGDVRTEVIEACLREDISEGEQYAIIHSAHQLKKLNEDECKFLIENSNFDKVKGYANNSLAKIR